MAAKKTKTWKFQTIQSRVLATQLTEMSAAGETVFSVYPSMIAGSFDVLSYTEKSDGN